MWNCGTASAMEFARRLRKSAQALGPRAADLGSNLASDAGVAFVAGLACDAPARAPLVRGDQRRLPFQSGAFTGVLASVDADWDEVRRVLQPGGFAIVRSAARLG